MEGGKAVNFGVGPLGVLLHHLADPERCEFAVQVDHRAYAN